MDDCTLHEELRRQTGEALRRHASAALWEERRRAASPVAGELLLMRETAEHAIEWAVLGSAPDEPQRVLMVPADTVPLVGSADVEVPADDAAGPLSLRCRYGLWRRLGDSDLGPRQGSVAVAPEYVAWALEKYRAIAARALVGSASERDVDTDPEYQEWEEVLALAQGALERSG
ncbi:MAG: hypothetical protein GY856_46595 [bacterium]|nr:hypothetical protein [bacterium]